MMTKGRSDYLDSAKFVLVQLVVIGHLLEQVRQMSPIVGAAYRFIYMFHVPALVLMSGLVAHASFDARQGKRWLATLVLPYLVFQGIYLYVDAIWQGNTFAYGIVQPYWLLWYLFSLASWRLLLPVMLSLRHPVCFAVAIALVAGCIKDVQYPFSLSRTLVFLPFFVAGHLHGERLVRSGPLLLAPLVLVTLGVLAWWFRGLSPHWFYASLPYAQMKAEPWQGMLVRLGLIGVGMVGTWSVIRLMPAGSGWLARLGKYSLGMYLLHGLVIRFAISRHWFALAGGMNVWVVVLGCVLLGLALGLFACLASRWLKPIMNYEWLWTFDRNRKYAVPVEVQEPRAPRG